MIEIVDRYLRKSKEAETLDGIRNWYWFILKDSKQWPFYVCDNIFYFGRKKLMWLEALQFIEMIGDDWNG